jgi:NADPH-dependent FMN reductase
MTPYKLGYFVGSLAKASINGKLAHALVRLAPEELECAEISFKDLPLYSYDYDASFPPAVQAFKQAIASVDAVLLHSWRAEECDRLGKPANGQSARARRAHLVAKDAFAGIGSRLARSTHAHR